MREPRGGPLHLAVLLPAGEFICGVLCWHDCCLFGTRGPSLRGTPPVRATPGVFPTSLSLNPILGVLQPSSLARIRGDKWGTPTKLRVPLPTLCPWDAWSRPAWHCPPPPESDSGPGLLWGLLALGVASVPLVPSPSPSPSPHAWAPLSPISRQQLLCWLLALGFRSLSCSFV